MDLTNGHPQGRRWLNDLRNIEDLTAVSEAFPPETVASILETPSDACATEIMGGRSFGAKAAVSMTGLAVPNQNFPR